jgi:hypothetical protein
VRRLRPCLPLLRPLQARVLVLRAGVGDREPASRASGARGVERPVRVVRRAERRGVRRLRIVMRAGECTEEGAVAPDGEGAEDAVTATGSVGDATVDLADADAGGDAVGGSGAGGDTGGAGGVKGESRSGGKRGGSGNRGPIAGVVPRPPEAVGITVPLLVALAGITWLVARRVRMRRDA